MRYFGTDGIRGRAGEGRLAPDEIARIGRALGRFASGDGTRAPRVALGRDPRPSGPGLVAALSAALIEVGAEVEDLGVVPTPVVAWTVADRGYDLGIAVSASHNPPGDNGIKPFAAGGRKLTNTEEVRIEAFLADDDGHVPPDVHPAVAGAADDYVEATSAWLRPDGGLDGLRLVVDLSAGAASATAPAVLSALGADVVVLHEAGSRDINDGCGTEHPAAWLERVAAEGADVGLAFDGDADRVLLAGSDGVVVDGDDALAILAEDGRLRGRLPGDVVVGTVMANLGVEERLASLGVRLERVGVGDRQVAQCMRETGAAVGAEPSGHVVLERDGALIGDGLVAGVRILQAAARLGRPLAELRTATPRYPQLLRNVRLEERRPLAEWPALTDAVEAAERDLAGRGRVLVRYSGTEPLLRIMAEGRDSAEVEAAVASIERVARA